MIPRIHIPKSERHPGDLLAFAVACSSRCRNARPGPEAAPAPHFSGQAAYNLTAAAPRGRAQALQRLPGHLKAEEFIKQHFAAEAAKGNFETDTFTASTPVGLSRRCTTTSCAIPAKKTASSSSPPTTRPTTRSRHRLRRSQRRRRHHRPAHRDRQRTSAPIRPRATPSGWSSTTAKRPSQAWSALRLHLRHPPPRRQVVAGRHPRQDQGLPRRRHDRRQRPQHRPRRQLHAVAARLCSQVAAKNTGHSAYIFKTPASVERRPSPLRAARRSCPRRHRRRLRPPHRRHARRLPPHRAGHARQDQRQIPPDLRRPLPRNDPPNQPAPLNLLKSPIACRPRRGSAVPFAVAVPSSTSTARGAPHPWRSFTATWVGM